MTDETITLPRKVLELALEALESCDYTWDHIGEDEFQTKTFDRRAVEQAIYAINEVLTPVEDLYRSMGMRREDEA